MRNIFIDNGKGALIFFVVLGHYLEALGGWQHQYLTVILSIIYLFHMPAFAFLAGVTAKREQLGSRIAHIAAILVVFQLAYLIPIFINQGKFPVGPLQPYWLLWFLLSLIWWMLLLPLIVRLPGALAISVAIALIGGLYPGDGYQLSIMRTLTFLPFFVGGHLYGNRILVALQTFTYRRLIALQFLGVTALVMYFLRLERGWLFGSLTHAQLGFDDAPGTMIRTGLFLLSSASVLAFLACTTNKRGYLSVVGQNSLAVFLLHGFAIIIARGMFESTGQSVDFWSIVLVIFASVVTTLVLAHPRVTTAVRSIPDYISSLFLKATRIASSLREHNSS